MSEITAKKIEKMIYVIRGAKYSINLRGSDFDQYDLKLFAFSGEFKTDVEVIDNYACR